jgi:hypothetical protein
MHSKSPKRANMTLNSFGKNIEKEVQNPKNKNFFCIVFCLLLFLERF